MLLWRESFSVFPTHVGVILYGVIDDQLAKGIPHACGGDPQSTKTISRGILVFPTHVGVILFSAASPPMCDSIPHACGGDPKMYISGLFNNWYSPRMWG